jgi:ribose 5-phosphate isomerase A
MKQMIKGRGGAFLREKILFNYADAVFIVADQSKMVDRLCTNHPLPVEVTIDASTYVAQALVSLGATSVSLRLAEGKDGPVITENRNVILDTRWNDLSRAKNNEIVGLPGVVETGFFHRTDVEILSE